MTTPKLSRRLFGASLLALTSAAAIPAGIAFAAGKEPYRNPSLPIDARIEDLLARMTLEEKVAQMIGIWQDKKRLFAWLMNEGRPFLTRDISL